MSEKDSNKTGAVSYKDTLNLPRTDFPIRSNPKVDDKAMLERWDKEDLSKKSFEAHKGKEKFILHDGPPYANGHIHLGHAYNKILKDIVCKSQRMLGKQVPVTPGWDCHGLPIEQKVTQETKDLDPIQLKKACRVYANKWIDIQRSEFKNLGVLMNWNHPYLTMNYEYEASILKAFGDFVAQGYIERKNKTVPWCPTDQTVLASAEIEYQERKDPSIYVLFPLAPETIKKVFPKLAGQVVNLLVWTTTPWTLPLNRAVILKPHTHYEILETISAITNAKNYFVVAKVLSDKICSMLQIEKKVVAEFSSQALEGGKVGHPFIPDLIVPIILDQSVSLEDGTACVHSAPGCGPEDYEIAIRNGLEIFSPLSPDGKYTKGIKPEELEGMSVNDAQGWVINQLSVLGRLFYKTSIKHSYPHCWRCRNGLIFRATKQWFCDLSKNNLRQKAVDAVDTIKMYPDKSANRFKATLEGRLEWCLSRQRVWGVPIPAFLCTGCDEVYTNQSFIDEIAKGVAKEGIEYWDNVIIDKLLPKDYVCKCGRNLPKDFKKETDILDVWFDSGVSHFAVLYHNPELHFPADIYFEGKDQHRGWFQSSLLTSLVIEKKPSMKQIATHGYTVDALGRKMSKSLGNVISPQEIIDKIGTDGLRLWTSSIDLKDDPIVSEILLNNVQEVFRKIRNTCRVLLLNLYDFDITKDAVPVDKLPLIDQYALINLYSFNEKIKAHYQEYKFTTIFHELADYCAKDLSAFYVDIAKDRLYVEKADGHLRRSAQTVCWYILDSLTKLMAPILSFTAEQVSDYYQKNKTESIHLQTYADLNDPYKKLKSTITSTEFYKTNDCKAETDKFGTLIYWQKQWDILIQVRNAILKAIEEQRAQGIIKHSLEAEVSVCFDINNKEFAELLEFLKNVDKAAFFKEFLIVSKFNLVDKSDKAGFVEGTEELKGLFVNAKRVEGDKCPRCWNYEVSNHPDKLCKRCQKIVGK